MEKGRMRCHDNGLAVLQQPLSCNGSVASALQSVRNAALL